MFSQAFPGLRLNIAALLDHDGAKVRATPQAALDSPEHTAFIARLGQR